MDKTPLTQGELWSALLPWIIVCILMLIWGNDAFKAWANSHLHLELSRSPTCTT